MESAPTDTADVYCRGAFYMRPRADASIRPYRVGYNMWSFYSHFFFFSTPRYTAYTANAAKLIVVPVRRPGVW